MINVITMQVRGVGVKPLCVFKPFQHEKAAVVQEVEGVDL